MTRAGKILLAVIAILLVICAVAVCNIRTTDDEDTARDSSSDFVSWPTDGLAAELPTPPVTDRGAVASGHDNVTTLDVDLYGVSAEAYAAYAEQCRSAGFDVEAATTDHTYDAYDDEGRHLKLTYYTLHDGELEIDLDAPVEYGALSWPSVGPATRVPTPQSTRGTVERDRSDYFAASVADTTLEEYRAYVDACVEAGFAVDYSRGERSFYGVDAEGCRVDVDYLGFEVMRVTVDVPDEQDATS